MKLKHRADQLGRSRHRDWADRVLLLLNALVRTDPAGGELHVCFEGKPMLSIVANCNCTVLCLLPTAIAALAGRLMAVWLRGLLHSVFRHSVQSYFVCCNCACCSTLTAPQPFWVFTLTMNATSKLEDALEEYFMARSLDYQIQCKAMKYSSRASSSFDVAFIVRVHTQNGCGAASILPQAKLRHTKQLCTLCWDTKRVVSLPASAAMVARSLNYQIQCKFEATLKPPARQSGEWSAGACAACLQVSGHQVGQSTGRSWCNAFLITHS